MKNRHGGITAHETKWLFFHKNRKKVFCLPPKYTHKSYKTGLSEYFSHFNHIFTDVGLAPYDKNNIKPGFYFDVSYIEALLKSRYFQTFAIAIHPFARLIDGYRSRTEPHNNRIIQAKSLPSTEFDHLPRLVAHFANESDPNFWNHGVTFETFLKYITTKQKTKWPLLPMWTPFTQICMPCIVPYDYIGRFEDMDQSSEQLLRILYNDRKTFKNVSNPLKNTNKIKIDKLISKYFKQVSEEVINDIVNIYKYDFELLGYDTKILV